MDEHNRSLDTTLEQQSNVVTRRQLIACAIDDRVMTRRVKRGNWLRLLPGIYLVPAGPISTEQRRIAAALYAGRSAQITGQAALHWYGFRHAPASDRVHVLIPHERSRRSFGFVLVQRTHELDPRVREAERYQLTSPARAVVDACRTTSDLRTARAVMTEAVQAQFVSLKVLEDEVRRAGRSRTAIARRVLAELEHGIRSSPEAELRELVSSSEVLPAMLWNPRLVDSEHGTVLPTPDGWMPEVGIALEVDSREHHFDPEDWARTLRRNNRLAQHGVLVLHFTPREIRDEPRRVLRVVERAYLGRLASRPVPTVSVGAPL